MSKYGSIFTGGGLADIGALMAGYEIAWGVEYDAKIAAVANANLGGNVLVADVLGCDPRDFEPVDLFHASPPCTRASLANKNGGETALDLALADKTCEFIRVLKPRAFTLENVRGYRNFESFRRICKTLEQLGYMVDFRHIDASKHGVPQSRIRLWLRAVHGSLIGDIERSPGGGWYAAIEDLIDTCPLSQLAPWQEKRFKSDILPALIDGQNSHQMRPEDEAHISRGAHDASWTVQNKLSRIVLVDSNNTRVDGSLTARYADSPSYTQTGARTTALGRIADGITVRMCTSRCMARFQTVPDWYVLPPTKSLAIKILCNGVPSELARRIYVSISPSPTAPLCANTPPTARTQPARKHFYRPGRG